MGSAPGVYAPLGMEGYELCHPEDPDDFERINVEVDGTPRRSTWDPVTVRLIRKDEGQQLETSDSPWLGGHALILRRSAVRALTPMLEGNGELLPLVCPEADLVVYNPTHVIDGLDASASLVRRFADGSIMMVQRYAFRAAVVAGIDVFKIPDLRVSPTFVSARFVDRWKAGGLRGLAFQHVWSLPT